MRGTLFLLLVLGACSTAEHVLGPTTYDVSGVWRFDQSLHNNTLNVTCGSQGNITVSQDGPHFTAQGLQSGYCQGPGGSQNFIDEPFAITNGTIDGATIAFKDSECSYRGTAHGTKPDSVSGTANCQFTVDNQNVTLTGTWSVIPPPDDVPPTLTATTFGGGANDSLETGDDTLYVHIVASDNVALRAIGYTITDPSRGTIVRQDSIVLTSNTVAALDDTLIFPLPLNLILPVPYGTAFQGSAFVRDTAGNVAQTPITPFAVYPARPPVATGSVTGSTRPDSAGALRDTLDISVTVHSPRPLRYIGYRLTNPVGIGDSVAVTDSVASHSFRLAIPFEWKGLVIGVGVFGRDRLALEGGHQIAEMRVVIFPNRPTQTFRVGQGVSDVVYDRPRDRLYLMTSLDSTAQAGQPEVRRFQFSPGGGGFLPGIPLSSFADGMDLSPGGDSLLLALYNQRLGIVNLNTLAQDSTAPIAFTPSNGRYPFKVRAMANGKALIAIASAYWGAGDPGQLVEFDLGTQTQTLRTDVGAAGDIGLTPLLGRTPDRARLVLYPSKPAANEAQLYLSAGNSFAPSAAGAPAGAVTLSSDSVGSLWLVGNELLDGSLVPLRQLGTGIYSGTSVISYDGQYAYVAVPEGVAKFRTSDGARMELILLQTPPYKLSITPDGNTLMAISGSGLQIIDLR